MSAGNKIIFPIISIRTKRPTKNIFRVNNVLNYTLDDAPPYIRSLFFARFVSFLLFLRIWETFVKVLEME